MKEFALQKVLLKIYPTLTTKRKELSSFDPSYYLNGPHIAHLNLFCTDKQKHWSSRPPPPIPGDSRKGWWGFFYSENKPRLLSPSLNSAHTSTSARTSVLWRHHATIAPNSVDKIQLAGWQFDSMPGSRPWAHTPIHPHAPPAQQALHCECFTFLAQKTAFSVERCSRGIRVQGTEGVRSLCSNFRTLDKSSVKTWHKTQVIKRPRGGCRNLCKHKPKEQWKTSIPHEIPLQALIFTCLTALHHKDHGKVVLHHPRLLLLLLRFHRDTWK